MSEQTAWAFRGDIKVHVNRLRLISGAGPPQGALWPHARGLHLGREQTWTPWINSGKVEAWEKLCLSEGGKEDAPLVPLLPSLVVHQRLDFVHQLTSYLQDVVDVVTLGHFCR